MGCVGGSQAEVATGKPETPIGFLRRSLGRTLRPVNSIGVKLIQVVNAVLQLIAAMAFVDAQDKEGNVGVQ